MVWTEIKSFIKGCTESFSNPEGFLTKEQYVHVGKKRAPTFVDCRDEVYALFLKYRKLKKN